jgi:hypothetical protein
MQARRRGTIVESGAISVIASLALCVREQPPVRERTDRSGLWALGFGLWALGFGTTNYHRICLAGQISYST